MKNGNGNGNPWNEEELTPVEPPPIRENEGIVWTLGLVVNRLDNLRQDIRDIARAYRIARTPLGEEMTGEIVRSLRDGFDDLKETVVKVIQGPTK